jgi:hypothetical protein
MTLKLRTHLDEFRWWLVSALAFNTVLSAACGYIAGVWMVRK